LAGTQSFRYRIQKWGTLFVLPQTVQLKKLKIKSKVIINTSEFYCDILIPYSGVAEGSRLLGR
jgi:hypothetical protein